MNSSHSKTVMSPSALQPLHIFFIFILIVSYLSWGNCFASLYIFPDCFYVCVYYMMIIWRSPFFVLLSSSFLLFCMFLKYALSLIHLKKSFESPSSSFLLYTFGVAIKFKFLFKSFYSVLVTQCLVKLIIFPFGSD